MKVRCTKKYGWLKPECEYSLDPKRKFTREALKAQAIEEIPRVVNEPVADTPATDSKKKGSK